jgi:hypothetical protein
VPQAGVSDASVYKWKAKSGGMELSEAKRLRALEDDDQHVWTAAFVPESFEHLVLN